MPVPAASPHRLFLSLPVAMPLPSTRLPSLSTYTWPPACRRYATCHLRCPFLPAPARACLHAPVPRHTTAISLPPATRPSAITAPYLYHPSLLHLFCPSYLLPVCLTYLPSPVLPFLPLTCPPSYFYARAAHLFAHTRLRAMPLPPPPLCRLLPTCNTHARHLPCLQHSLTYCIYYTMPAAPATLHTMRRRTHARLPHYFTAPAFLLPTLLYLPAICDK